MRRVFILITIVLFSCLGLTAGDGAVHFGEIMVQPLTATLASKLKQVNRQFREAPVTRDNYDLIVRELLAVPVGQGYYYALVNLQRIEPYSVDGQTYLNPIFYLDWGEQVIVEDFIWEGIQKTDEDFLTSQVQYLQGRVYQPEIGLQLKRRLAIFPFLQIGDNLRLVKTVEGKYGLVIPVQERNENQFSGIIGRVPESLNKPGYFTGEMNLKMLNIGGKGRGIEIYWSKPDRFSQHLKLKGSLPNLLRSSSGGSVEFQQTLRDTLVVMRNLVLGGSQYFANGLEWQEQVAYTAIMPTPGGRSLLDLTDVTVLALKSGLRIDRRDNAFAPRRGWYLATFWTLGQRRENRQTYWQTTLENTGEIHFPLSNRWHLAALSHYYGSFSQAQLKYGDYYFLGGARSLRGYPEEFFSGIQVGWSTLELRWSVGDQNRIFLFCDQGYYQAKKTWYYPRAFGFGFRLESRLGLIGLDYGLGKGDTFTTAKIHLHIENWF